MKKKTFARFLTLALCCTSLAYSAAAFEPETPEAAAEIAVAEDELALAGDVQYAARPAENDETLGKLIYFNNGNDADTLNASLMNLIGLESDIVDTNGYATRRLSLDARKQLTYGQLWVLMVSAPDGVSFKGTDGKALDGTLTMVVDFYNVSGQGLTWRHVWRNSTSNWNGVSTDWAAIKSSASAELSTIAYTRGTDEHTFGFASYELPDNSNDANKNVLVRSVSVYYMPKLNYAEKPAETDETLGNLIYFNNGYKSDTLNDSLMNLVGLESSVINTNGYATRRLSLDTRKQMTWGQLWILMVSAADGVSFKGTDGKELNGTLTMVVDFYNVSGKELTWRHAWRNDESNWNGVSTDWVSIKSSASADLSTIRYSRNTDEHTFGFVSYELPDNANDANKNVLVRSVSVYYKPLLDEAIIKTSDSYSVRTSDPSGIRFGGFIEAKTMFVSDECGFIIARGDQIAANNYNADEEVRIVGEVTDSSSVNFTAVTQNGLKMVGARNYVKDTEINKLVAADGGKTPFGIYEKDGFYFTGVVTNLDGSYTNAQDGIKYTHRYNAPLVARTYVKIGSAYFYGECVNTSLYDVVFDLLSNEETYEQYEQNKEFFDKIIAEFNKKA